MMSKREIHAGDDSTNVQDSEHVTVNHTHHHGVTYADVREIAIDIFKANFYELSENAKNIAVERAELLINKMLEKLQSEAPETLSKIENPDVQYAVINAQKQYARSGKPETLSLLTDLLKDRFLIDEGSLKAIVLNEAIEVLPKLTENQIKIICAIFLVKKVRLSSARFLIENVQKFLTDPGDISNESIPLYEHLLFVGVASHDNLVTSSQNLEYFIRSVYKDELHEKIEGNQKELVEPPIRAQYEIDDISREAFSKWNNSLANRYSLTTVGIAIALAYFNGIWKSEIDLNIWIKD
ncbi:LPO_1073/Vpar_1526 family protein [Planococcus sp. FY231025]|uniref:LPO_1073/Vpar_1526 family protein n=1 Tax=Planococcus sp. FY231025 TaxID=3455699 RepID=UPI003F906ECF